MVETNEVLRILLIIAYGLFSYFLGRWIGQREILNEVNK